MNERIKILVRRAAERLNNAPASTQQKNRMLSYLEERLEKGYDALYKDDIMLQKFGEQTSRRTL